MLLKNPIIIKTGMFQILYERKGGGQICLQAFSTFPESWREWLAQTQADIKVIAKIFDLKPVLCVSVTQFLKVQKIYFLF